MHGPPVQGHQKASEECCDITAAGTGRQPHGVGVASVTLMVLEQELGWFHYKVDKLMMSHHGHSTGCQLQGSRDTFQAGAATASHGGGILLHASWSLSQGCGRQAG